MEESIPGSPDMSGHEVLLEEIVERIEVDEHNTEASVHGSSPVDSVSIAGLYESWNPSWNRADALQKYRSAIIDQRVLQKENGDLEDKVVQIFPYTKLAHKVSAYVDDSEYPIKSQKLQRLEERRTRYDALLRMHRERLDEAKSRALAARHQEACKDEHHYRLIQAVQGWHGVENDAHAQQDLWRLCRRHEEAQTSMRSLRITTARLSRKVDQLIDEITNVMTDYRRDPLVELEDAVFNETCPLPIINYKQFQGRNDNREDAVPFLTEQEKEARKRKHREDLLDYEQDRTESLTYAAKSEELDDRLLKVHERLGSTLHILAHHREKTHRIAVDNRHANRELCVLMGVSSETSDTLRQTKKEKGAADTTKRLLSQKSGMLLHKKLLHSYETTASELAQATNDLQMLKDQYFVSCTTKHRINVKIEEAQAADRFWRGSGLL